MMRVTVFRGACGQREANRWGSKGETTDDGYIARIADNSEAKNSGLFVRVQLKHTHSGQPRTDTVPERHIWEPSAMPSHLSFTAEEMQLGSVQLLRHQRDALTESKESPNLSSKKVSVCIGPM